MALQITYKSLDGLEHSAAYGRVSVFQVIRTPRSSTRVRYWVELYVDQEKSLSENQSIATFGSEFSHDGLDVQTSEIYEHAKLNIPEFQNAIDI